MIRKLLFVVVIMLPLLSSAQQQRTIMISEDTYHHDMFSDIFNYITTPFHFVDRFFHGKNNFANRRWNNRFGFIVNGSSGFTYNVPLIKIDGNRINNRQQLILMPRREFFINNNGNEIIIKRNGQTISIKKDRRI